MITSVHDIADFEVSDFSHKSVGGRAVAGTYMTIFSIHPGMQMVSIHKRVIRWFNLYKSGILL